MNLNRRFFLDDALFAIALAIPTVFAAARYVDSEREKTAPASLQEERTAVAKSITPADTRTYHEPLASRTQSRAAVISKNAGI